MSTGLFCFLQVELPFALGPPDGRWLLRREPGGEVERVLVLRTVGASRADAPSRRRRPAPVAAAGEEGAPHLQAAPVQVARATVVDPRTVADEREAQTWLRGLDPEHAADEALHWINRLLRAHRIAAADPYVHEIGTEQALTVRAGFGEGEQVAEGRWLRALDLPVPRARRRGRRREAVRLAGVQERLAALLGTRAEALVCEELALRARLDLDAGRRRLAAIELERAYAAALVELRVYLPTIEARLQELRQLKARITELAVAALASDEPLAATDDAALEHALDSLEATLRVRSGVARPLSRSSD